MGRPLDQHVDNKELSALVPWPAATGEETQGIPPGAVSEAQAHLRSCPACTEKVAKYRALVERLSRLTATPGARPQADCPQDVDWHEVATGQWPEFKAAQLIMHAALCEHCGPLLRAATALDTPTAEEEALLAKVRAPSQPQPNWARAESPRPSWQFLKWLVPAVALLVIVAVSLKGKPSLSDPEFARFAVDTHRQHAQGNLALDVSFNSSQELNEWFKGKLPFSLALPASAPLPGEERPYHLVGARLVPAAGKTAVYIAYKLQAAPASLVVAPDSLAVASGGVVLGFDKVTFHYRVVDGYRVVTWSSKGNTYALVSQEENSDQRSCMVCHSEMRDRDLSNTPAPLSPGQLILQ